jgi:O-6-methylguanine DNA methyltransferase
MIAYTTFNSPLGTMRAGATDSGICLFDFEDRKNIDGIMRRITHQLQEDFVSAPHTLLSSLQMQADEYFAGKRMTFDLPLLLVGTHFQCNVWKALQQIPYGATRSYLQQSRTLGNEKAVRAVAAANGENGIAIVVPCHRVVGSGGSLTGYGGGLHRKQWLLEHERQYSGAVQQGQLF